MEKILFEALFPDVAVPQRGTSGAAGYDLKAHVRGRTLSAMRDAIEPVARKAVINVENVENATLGILPGTRVIIPLGFKATLPPRIEAQIRPRSGTSFKTGLTIANAPGTIDEDYPEEWGVIVTNNTSALIEVQHGERIAQMVLARYEVAEFYPGVVVPVSERTGGFGSTGVK